MERRTAEREAGEAEQKRRKGGRPKATWDTEDGRARLLARRAKEAARDAHRRQRKREASVRAQQPVRCVRQQRRSGSARSVARSDQCEGITLEGLRCRVHAGMTHVDEAAPLRAGGRFCAHHEPDAARAGVTRCAATRRDGKPCRVTSACSNGRTLREGAYCRNHLSHAWTPPSDCAGVDGACAAALGAEADASVADALGLKYCDACTASWRAVNGRKGRVVRCRGMCRFSGRRCMVNSLMPHDGAEPLRAGGAFCLAHGWPQPGGAGRG